MPAGIYITQRSDWYFEGVPVPERLKTKTFLYVGINPFFETLVNGNKKLQNAAVVKSPSAKPRGGAALGDVGKLRQTQPAEKLDVVAEAAVNPESQEIRIPREARH